MISKGALYHKDKVEGQPICQLCVPQCKRVHALKLAYNSASDCHHGVSIRIEKGSGCYLAGLECARACTAMLGRALRVDYGPDRRRPTPTRQVGR